MKKILLVTVLASFVMVGCANKASTNGKELETLQETINSQAELVRDYEAIIDEQSETIEELTKEIAILKVASNVDEQTVMDDLIFVFKGDETASYVHPTVIPYKKENDLVETIHNYVSGRYDIGLNGYRFEDDGKLLILDYDENANRVQGSAGTYIFLKSMTESYFANLPNLLGIKLLLNGDGSQEVIGQSGSNDVFVREPFSYEPPDIEW